MKNALKMHNILLKHNFSQKLYKRMENLGFYNTKKGTSKEAIITLHNLLDPDKPLSYTDIPPRKYYDWLEGKKAPDKLSTFMKLCEVLNVDIDYFFTDTEAPTRDIGFIADTLNLSPKAIENLLAYDSNYLRLLNNLICTQNPEYPEYKGSLQALLKVLYDFGLHAGTSEVRLIDGLTIDTVKDNHVILELLKRIPQKALDNCLLIASQSTSKDRSDQLKKQLIELEEKINAIKEGD